MKIIIISDTHDNLRNIRKLLDIIKAFDALIHCGDLCAPFVIAELANFDGEVHCCFGNTDDRFVTPKIAAQKGVKFYGDLGEFKINNKKIAFTHFPEFAEGLAATGKYDAVFHGHTHSKRKLRIKECWLVNPGEIMGRIGKPSYAVYDTETNEIEIIEFD